MELSNVAILVFFLGGVALHIFARLAYPWTAQQQPWFWLIVMGLFGTSMFLLPEIVGDKRLANAMNSVLAGVCVSEYMRNRYKNQLEKIFKFRNDVDKWKKAAANPSKKQSKPNKDK